MVKSLFTLVHDTLFNQVSLNKVLSCTKETLDKLSNVFSKFRARTVKDKKSYVDGTGKAFSIWLNEHLKEAEQIHKRNSHWQPE